MGSMKLPYMILEIIDNYQQILQEARKLRPPKPLTPEEKAEGLRSSKLGASTPKEVAMTPLMSEILKRTGEKTGDEWRLYASDPLTKAEEYVNDIEKRLLLQFNGSEKTTYDEKLPIDSPEHYNVQCWRQRKENKRDIGGKEQEEERKDVSLQYSRETEALDLVKLLQTDKTFQKAVMLVCNALPEVKANKDYDLVSLPFMNKDSNVTYPWFRNDRAVDPKTGKTYGQMAIDLAKTVPLDRVHEYNYTTLYGRNQKLKGRMICATSRIVNIIFNQLEAEEIKAYREKSPLFVGYKDDVALKEALQRMRDQCKQLGLSCRNVDQTKFDLHVNKAFIILVGAISMMKANGRRSKELALKRAVLATRSWLINGLTNSVYEIYGRIMSGYIDTNRGGGIINAIAVLYAAMCQDPKYSDIVYALIYWMLVMGDDNLFAYKTLIYKIFKEALKRLKLEVNEEKDEYGLFFLQFRLFTDADGDHMTYAWNRVLRSLLMKEIAKGLGPYGWDLAWWQQISKVKDYKPALSILVNVVHEFDDLGLCLDISVSDLIKHIDDEDAAAKAKLSTDNAKSKFVSTWDKIADGDPQKARFTRDNEGYLAELQSAMKEVYDPNFFDKYHLPKLPKVDK